MAKQIIDTATGGIALRDNFTLSRNSRVEELVEALGKENFDLIDVHANGAHCKIWNLHIDEKYFLFDFYFKEHRLHFTTFILDEKPIAAGNWDAWSKKEELAREKYFAEWLSRQTGGYKKFSWGVVDACYDGRSGSSYIFLNYSP